jgi:hypothetical protein
LLGVHPNTVRAWTDQGRLRCLRINERGDRRYRAADLQAFLHEAGLQSGPLPAFGSRISRDTPEALLRPRPVDALAPITSIAPMPVALPSGPSAQGVPATITPLVPVGFELADSAAVLAERSLVTQIRDALVQQEDLLDGLREAASTFLEGRRFRSVAIQELRADRGMHP